MEFQGISQKQLTKAIASNTGVLEGFPSNLEKIKEYYRNRDQSFLENTECGLSDNEKDEFIKCFMAWTGLNYDDFNGDYYNHGPDGYDDQERIVNTKLSSVYWLTGDVDDLNRANTQYYAKVKEGYSEQEMLDELNRVRKFLAEDLNTTLGLEGRMAEINTAMFMKDLEPFSEEELMAYVSLFHIDVQILEDLQEAISENYSKLAITAEITNPILDEQQELNKERYLSVLKGIILEYKLWMLDRLRLWRWREEVLLGKTGDELPMYPGVPVACYFETSSELLEAGISNYFMRVGEIKRENLTDYYEYFDLYHMVGMLGQVHSRNIKYDTTMDFQDLADLLMDIIEELALDPRHLLTPIGIHIIFNFEKGETIFNLSQYKPNGHDVEILAKACSDAGIELNRTLEIELNEEKIIGNKVLKAGDFIKKTLPKPSYVLLEELTSQYLSPQFYAGIENHRDFEGALKSLKTLSGDRVTNANKSELIFYGIGDGLSTYTVYTPSELANIFISTKRFFDPVSIKLNPEEPFKWSLFSLSNIQRLLNVVIPRMRVSARGINSNGEILQIAPSLEQLRAGVKQFEERGYYIRKDLDDLEKAIVDNFDYIDIVEPNTIDEIIKPRKRQENIINYIKDNLDNFVTTKSGEVVNLGIREDLALFIAFLRNLGKQFSDWDEDMISIDENAVASAILSDPNYKRIDPEWTYNLTFKIFNMLTLEFEPYLNVKTKTINQEEIEEGEVKEIEDFSSLIRQLRMVKFYQDAYKIDWYDELATIEGQISRLIQANKLGLYEYIKIVGNWFISTAAYYTVIFFDYGIGENEIDLTENGVTLQDYELLEYPEEPEL